MPQPALPEYGASAGPHVSFDGPGIAGPHDLGHVWPSHVADDDLPPCSVRRRWASPWACVQFWACVFHPPMK